MEKPTPSVRAPRPPVNTLVSYPIIPPSIIIPANNRGRKALATVYWLLVRQILIEKGELKENESMKYEIDDFEAKMTEEEIE